LYGRLCCATRRLDLLLNVSRLFSLLDLFRSLAGGFRLPRGASRGVDRGELTLALPHLVLLLGVSSSHDSR
jgi:hypothetical protein